MDTNFEHDYVLTQLPESLKFISFNHLDGGIMWWYSGKNLELRGLFFSVVLGSSPWLLIWWPLEAYMIGNFRARVISRGARKLARTPTLI
jgi:hypothetical protein